MTHDLWSTLNRKMLDYLASVNLAELVDKQRQRVAANQNQAAAGKAVAFNVTQAA